MKVYRDENYIIIDNPEHGKMDDSGHRESRKRYDKKNKSAYTLLMPCFFTPEELKAIIETPEIYDLLYKKIICFHFSDEITFIINGETIDIRCKDLLEDLKSPKSHIGFSNRLKVRQLRKKKNIFKERLLLLNEKYGKLTLKEIYEIYFSNEPVKKCKETGISFDEFLSIIKSRIPFLDNKEFFDMLFKGNENGENSNSFNIDDKDYAFRRNFYSYMIHNYQLLVGLYTSNLNELKQRLAKEEMLFENYINLIGNLKGIYQSNGASKFPEFEEIFTKLFELYDKHHENYVFSPTYYGQHLLEEYSISPKIIQTFLSELESLKEYNLSDIQKAIYLYRRICQKFSYDDEFFATGQIGSNLPQRDLSKVDEFDFDNNLVVCINIAYIYAKVCQAVGIKVELREKGYQASNTWIYTPNSPHANKHPHVLVWADGYEIAADPAIGLVNNDMQYAKLGRGPQNLLYIGFKEDLKYAFEKEKRYVDQIIAAKKRDYEFYDINDMLTRFSSSEGLTEEEIVHTFLSVVEEINKMPGTMMAKLHVIKEFRKRLPFIPGLSIEILGVGDNMPIDKKKSAALAVIITVSYNNSSNYYFVKSGGDTTKISKEELTSMIMSDKVSYLSDEHSMIPGIEVSKDKVK